MNTTHTANGLLQQPENLFYVESSLPAGVTLSEYRRSRPRRPTRWERLKRLAGGPQTAAA